MRALIAAVLGRLRGEPFRLDRPERLDAGAAGVFVRAFGGAPPDFPHHFVARHRVSGRTAAYVHYTSFQSGIYLCGGLCVDSRVYRLLSERERRLMAGQGSLARWISDRSIAALEDKLAVFAYTGDVRSQRDAAALGFEPARPPHLFVQWHAATAEQRQQLVEAVAAAGPF